MADQNSPAVLRVDAHAHVMRRDHPVIPNARHRPDHDALMEDLLSLHDRHCISHGVLTAPSIYGADNSLLLAALAAAPRRLRGTIIIDSHITRDAVDAFARQGVVGIRFNMLRRHDLPDLRAPEWRRALAHVAGAGWHIEIYVEGSRLPGLLQPALDSGAKVVVDHFGSPDPKLRLQCPGFCALLDAMAKGRTWTKLSAPYRLGGTDPIPYAQALLRAGGPERLVWASDWPWTQHSAGLDYAAVLGWLDQWVPEPARRAQILGATAHSLFGFAA